MNEKPRQEHQLSALLHELRSMDSDQRRHLRQLCFWVLLVYLEFEWTGKVAIPIAIAAIAFALFVWLTRQTRRSFLVLHGAIATGMVLQFWHSHAWIVLADFALLGALVVLELKEPKPQLLIAIAIEHALGLAFDPATALRFLANHSEPQAAVLAWTRLFAIIMVLAIAVRVHWWPRLVPERLPPPPPPKPARPMTAAEWDAQQRNR